MPLAVCATPIGNLGGRDAAGARRAARGGSRPRARTRVTRGLLLARHAISARLLSLHEHNEAQRIRELIPRLLAGERIALVSDAGLPGISDPGSPLVRAALSAGVSVTVLPGPSAVETALVASGLSPDPLCLCRFPAPAGRRSSRRSGRSSEAGRGRSWRSSPRGGCLRPSGRSRPVNRLESSRCAAS